MKITLFFILLSIVQSFAISGFSQNTRFTLAKENTAIEDVLGAIEKSSDYNFLYNNKLVDVNQKVTIDVENELLEGTLNELFKNTNIAYKIVERQIVLSPKEGLVANQQQQKTVSGKVTDSSGLPLPGVTVVVKGTTIGTMTDSQGNYTLSNVPEAAVLQVSFVGMKLQEIAVERKTTIHVKLLEDSIGLEEVVAIGYGTQRKSDLTGSVTQVKTDIVNTTAASNVVSSLQGRSAGVAVFTNSVPGSSPVIRIRGAGSISAGKDALYVVDGFPLMNNNLNDINPNDIASMEILKDASATAIYGSRGANGVVLITTKGGSKGQKNLTINSYFGIQNAARVPELLETDKFVPYINDMYKFRGGTAPFLTTTPTANTDWQNEVIQKNAVIQNYTVTFDGGSDHTNYMLSVGYYSQEGLIKKVGFDKFTVHNNLSHKFNNWLTVGSHMQVTNSQKENGLTDVMVQIHQKGWPTMPIHNTDGSWFVSSLDPIHKTYIEGSFNPVLDEQATTNSTSNFRVLGDIYAEIQILKNLKFKANFGTDINYTRGYIYTSTQTAAALASNGLGSGSNAFSRNMTKLTENILSYNNTWGDHRFTATGVYSWQEFVSESLNNTISGFVNNATGAWDMGLGDRSTIAYSSGKVSNRIISYTSRLTYAYKDKYLLTATGRYDGSSRFGENNKYGFFPSLGLGWRVDQESFFPKNNVVSELKIRSSVGETGNQEIGNYRSLAQLGSANYVTGSTVLMGYTESIGNPNLKWERTRQYDIGFDLGLWKRLNVNFDYYSRKTSDLLYNVPIPSTSGFSSILSNVGEVQNHGIELTIGGRVVDDGDFKLDVSVNASHNTNEITNLYGNVDRIEVFNSTSGIASFLVKGHPVNSVWARQSLGIIQTQAQLDEYTSRIKGESAHLGAEMYADLDNNGSINTKDYVDMGSTEPQFFYGLTVNVGYKNFKLDIMGQGAHDYASAVGGDQNQWSESTGAYGFTNTSAYQLWADNNAANRYAVPTKEAYGKMWSDANPTGTLPRVGAKNVYLSDRTNANWNYFLLRNIQLSYTFKNPKLKGLEVFTNAQNYFSIANHSGYNPENGDESFPWAKLLTFGINAKF